MHTCLHISDMNVRMIPYSCLCAAMAAAAAASALASPNPKDSVDWNSVMAKVTTIYITWPIAFFSVFVLHNLIRGDHIFSRSELCSTRHLNIKLFLAISIGVE